jgi:general secretion pathway protein M
MNAWRVKVQALWQGVSPREQRLLMAAAALVSLALVWWLAVAPARAVLKSADAQHQALDAQLQQMQRLQAQARALQALPTLNAREAQAALQASIKQLGGVAQMTQQMDRATVTLQGVGAPALAQWLSATRQNAHVVPAEVHLKRSGADRWNGTVVFILAPQ